MSRIDSAFNQQPSTLGEKDSAHLLFLDQREIKMSKIISSKPLRVAGWVDVPTTKWNKTGACSFSTCAILLDSLKLRGDQLEREHGSSASLPTLNRQRVTWKRQGVLPPNSSSTLALEPQSYSSPNCFVCCSQFCSPLGFKKLYLQSKHGFECLMGWGQQKIQTGQ